MDKSIARKKKTNFFFLSCFFIAALGFSFSTDTPVRLAIMNMEGPTWNDSSAKKVVAAVSRYGDWPELMLLGIIGFLVARYQRSRRWQKIFLCAMLASTLAGAIVNTVRLTTGRTRPRVAEQHWYGLYHEGHWTVGKSELNSFPSGHTATAVAFATVILMTTPFWGGIAMVLALSIAGSRLLLGAHHPSDLLAALLVAIVAAQLLKNHIESDLPAWIERLLK
jgi:membrane-associated phospholipid phosphatase